jgi:hypothetical protein
MRLAERGRMKGEPAMSDQASAISKTDERGYNVEYFAQKHRISIRLARALIEQFGDDRIALNTAAKNLRRT